MALATQIAATYESSRTTTALKLSPSLSGDQFAGIIRNAEIISRRSFCSPSKLESRWNVLLFSSLIEISPAMDGVTEAFDEGMTLLRNENHLDRS
ncbi:MAG: hypothetical protein IBX70_14485 [Clostridia bacterium]|nr:hypothetical protein [Clostridia bacterium]